MIRYPSNKFFNELDKNLQTMCKTLEKAVDVDIIPTSGLRSPAENEKAGGVANSCHLSGQAIDIACYDSNMRFKIVFGALASGFKRIGIAKDHIHLDIDKEKPQPIIFFDNM